MKRFCLDFIILTLCLGAVLCLVALPQGVLPVLPVLATFVALVCLIRIAYAKSVLLEEAALIAKQKPRKRAPRATKANEATAQACRARLHVA